MVRHDRLGIHTPLADHDHHARSHRGGRRAVPVAAEREAPDRLPQPHPRRILAMPPNRKNRNRERNPDGSFVSDDPTAAERVRAGRFQPGGKSPNPGGLPKAVKMIRDRIGELTRDGQDILEFMNRVMRGEDEDDGMDDPRLRFAAAEWLGDRYFGKPKQTVELQPGPAQPEQPQTPPLRDLLLVLDERDRGDLERILTNFERARTEGRLALPAGVAEVEGEGGETPN